MVLRLKKSSLSQDFSLLVAIIILATFLLSSWFAWQTYSNEEERITQSLAAQTARIERTLVDHFSYTEHMMVYMVRQISENGAGRDTAYIYDLLRSFRTDPKVDNLLSWSTFMWHNKDQQITVEGVKGVLDTPRDLSMRDYIPQTVKIPWVLYLGQPVYGAVSKQWVIPGGVGALDAKGHYIGGVSMGFNIAKLVAKLDQAINAPGISFALFDKDLVLIAQTPKSDFTEISQLLISHSKQQLALETSGLLNKSSLSERDKGFVYYQTLAKYPYIIVAKYDKTLSDHEIWNAMFVRIIEFSLIAFLIIAILFFLHHRIITPIVQLADTADKITQGDYALRSSYRGGGEVRKLSEAFNGMLEKIEEDKNTLEERVAERTASLQDALNVRHDFLNHLSHEIRTPVSSIHARSDILLELWDEFNHVELKESIQDIQRNALQVCNLVTNLLDLSKSRAGKMVYTMQEHDVAVIAAEVVEECRPLYSQKSLHLKMENTAEHTVTLCDATKIGQVIRNLLSNACRYTPSGKVELVISNSDMHCEDGRIVPSIALSVTDEGVGIPEGEQHKIFESFTQSSRTNTKAGGTGLGLAIALEIITAHHGQIWAENNQAGKGCAFVFLVPKCNAIG